MGFDLINCENNFRMEIINDKEQWKYLLLQFEDANLYQTWNFSKITQDENKNLHVSIYKGSQLTSIALIRIRTAPFVDRGIAYIYRGPLWIIKGENIDITIFYEIVNFLIDEFLIRRKYLLRIKPAIFSNQFFYENANIIKFKISPRIKKIEKTLILNLDDDILTIRNKFLSKWRNRLNQSEKNGLIIKMGDNRSMINLFIKLYKELRKRKKFKEYVNPKRILKLNEDQDERFSLKIFIAFKDEIPVSAIILSAIGTTGIYLLGATNNYGLKLKASYLLQWEAIKWLKSQEVKKYDLGGIDPLKNPGVYEFKLGITKNEVNDFGSLDFCNSIFLEYLVKVGELLHNQLLF